MNLSAREPNATERELIETWLLGACVARPYYSRAIAALRPLVVEGLGTVAVDCHWRLYVDVTWMNALDPEHAYHVIAAHEVEHLLRDHTGRARAVRANGGLWNICADAEINDDVDAKLLPPNLVLPATIGQNDGNTAEAYYTAIMDQVHEHQGSCGGGSGVGSPNEFELPGDGDAMTEADAEHLRESVAADVRAHAEQRGRGSVPTSVLVWADSMVRRVHVDWRDVLRCTLRATSQSTVRGRSDYSWSGIHRRSREVLRPITITRLPRIAVVVDTSGSMACDGGTVMGVVESIVRRRSNDVVIVQCDAEVTKKTRNALPKEYRGGGGTDMRVAMAAVEAEADIVVVVTDGETPWPASYTRPVVVVCTTAAKVPASMRVVRVS